MAGVFRTTEKELRFLLMFTESRGIYGFDDMHLVEAETEAWECVETLCKKGYLSINQQKEYEVDSTLELLLTVAGQPYGYLLMEDLRKAGIPSKTAVYFLDDVIGMIEQKDKEYELLWLPYLPLVIGETANLHTPFLNEKTTRLQEGLSEENTECIDSYLESGFCWQWEMRGKQLEDEERACNIFVLSDGKEQIMVKESEGKILISKPDKAAYVNTITEWMAFVHGEALKKAVEEDRR